MKWSDEEMERQLAAARGAIKGKLVAKGVHPDYATTFLKKHATDFFQGNDGVWIRWGGRQYGPTHYGELTKLLFMRMPAGSRGSRTEPDENPEPQRPDSSAMMHEKRQLVRGFL